MSMSDPKFKIHLEMVIKGMVAVALHIRDCERCHRVYGAAFEASIAAKPEISGSIMGVYAPFSYEVLVESLRDLRGCESWPRGV